MANERILVVYYSRTGNTRCLAHAIAEATGGVVEEIIEKRDRRGIVNYLRAGVESCLALTTAIEPSKHEPRAFDLVVIATPIWNRSVPTPVRAYLRRHRGALATVAFGVTCGGIGIERVLRQLETLAGHAPRAVVTIRQGQLGELGARAATFARKIVGNDPRSIDMIAENLAPPR